MTTDNQRYLDPEAAPQEGSPAPVTATTVTPEPDRSQSQPEGHTVPPAAQEPAFTGEYPQPNESERVDYNAFPPREGSFIGTGAVSHQAESAKPKKKNIAPVAVAISGVATTIIAVIMFYLSLAVLDPVAAGLTLLLSSILLLVSIVLLLWGAVLGGKEIFIGDGDNTANIVSIVAAVILVPVAAFFGGIGMIGAIASWFTGFF